MDVGVGVDVNLNDQPPAGGAEQAEPVIDRMENGGERAEDLTRDAHVRNHMAALLEAIQQNCVALPQWLKDMVFDMKLLRLQQVMTPLQMLLKPEWVQQQPTPNLLVIRTWLAQTTTTR